MKSFPLHAARLCLVLLLSLTAVAGAKTRELSDETLALHPDVVRLRERVAQSPASIELLNDLGNLYARKGWDDLAIQTYKAALRVDRDTHLTWTNLGTLYGKIGDDLRAARAFRKAIALEPRAAMAHYNLGVVLDRQGMYDEAINEYKIAATLEPSLLDPAVNPQVVNNEHLTVIRLLTYLQEAGSSSLPLEDSGQGDTEMPDDAAADAAPPSMPAMPEKAPAPAAPPQAGTDETPASPPADGQRKGRRWKKRRQPGNAADAPSFSDLSFASDQAPLKMVLGTLEVRNATGVRLIGQLLGIPRIAHLS